MSLDVIGAGLGRTGTLSTKRALEMVGFERCYHMLEVARNPEHPLVWSRAAADEAVDWDAVFEGYRATTDWPACAFWPELTRAYPDAKVLLTVRDAKDWCASFRDTVARVIVRPFAPGAEGILEMAEQVILGATLEGALGDDDHLIACYERHNQRVIDAVDPDKLLVFDVRDGWEPLCAFLERPVPDEPFPNLNDRAFFHAMVEGQVAAPLSGAGG